MQNRNKKYKWKKEIVYRLLIRNNWSHIKFIEKAEEKKEWFNFFSDWKMINYFFMYKIIRYSFKKPLVLLLNVLFNHQTSEEEKSWNAIYWRGRQLVGEKRRGEKPIWEPVANN